MPQEIRVLKCFSCHMHQVDIVKKTNKWNCKMCGKKQSVFREIYRGSGADCRQVVQRLNMEKGEQENSITNEIISLCREDETDVEFLDHHEKVTTILAEINDEVISNNPNKWSTINLHRNEDDSSTSKPANIKRKHEDTISVDNKSRKSFSSKLDKFM